MEKIIFNKTEIEISGISNNGKMLDIQFNDGDIVALEESFANQAGLEKIVLTDQDGKTMNVYKNYSILKSIRKDKDVVIDEINDTKVDVVTVTLEQEPEWKTETRKLAELQAMNTSGILDLAETVSGIVEGSVQ